ncbi:MAG: TatD family hydrolase [Actinobacteria bacterium]|nr:TatD family hydrolase [Actinomycetota bacterium]
MIDTHAHLHACADPPKHLVARAREAGVGRILEVGAWPDSWREVVDFCRLTDGVFPILGVHPHLAGEADRGDLEQLRELNPVAIGETGLDYYRDYAPHDAQRELFAAHLELASELGKAIVIHCRAAERDVLEALARFDGTVVLHCFSSPELLDPALDRGYYVSFAGNLTYRRAGELREAARAVPDDRILVETDCPYLAPQSRRGRPNEPAYVVETAAALAEVRGEDPPELEARLDANAARAFGLP